MTPSFSGFPEAPKNRFAWAPYFIEPLAGSGERITAIIAVAGEAGLFQTKIVLRDRVLRCMYGDQAKKLKGMAEICERSLIHHLASGGALSGWTPPLTSVVAGEVRFAFGANADDVVRRSTRLTASTSGVDLVEDDAPTANSGAPEVEHWINEIKSLVAQRSEVMAAMFNQQIELKAGAMRTKVGFSGNRLAANFDGLAPGTNFAAKRYRAKARLLDLQALRDQVDLVKRASYELMLWIPPSEGSGFSNRDIAASRSTFLELEEIGDKHQIRVLEFSNAEQAALRIVKAESEAA